MHFNTNIEYEKDNIMISNNYNLQSPSFGSLRVCYGAEDNLHRLPKPILEKLYRFGDYLKDTKHVDMYIGPDLKPCIRAKLDKKGGIFPPFEYSKPSQVSKDFVVKARRVGKVPYGNAKGDNVEISLKMKNTSVAMDMFDRMSRANGDFEKAGILTKLIDSQLDAPNILAQEEVRKNMTKTQVINNIMSDFGFWNK